VTDLTAPVGRHAIGTQFATPAAPDPATVPAVPTGRPSEASLKIMQGIVSDLSRKLGDLQKAVSLKVDRDRILSGIWVTPEDVLIASEKVSVVGDVTFADWQRDISGQAIGGVAPSITRIRGGVIQTEKILSFDELSYIDLDAAGADIFIRSHDSVLIAADGSFSFGAPGKALTWNNVDLSIGNNVLLGSTAVGTVVAGANMGAQYPGDFTASILSNSGTQIQGYANTLFKFVNGVNELDIGAGGLFAVYNGVTTFALNTSTGSASYGGDVSTFGVASFFGGTTPNGSGGYCGVRVAGNAHGIDVSASGGYSAAILKNLSGGTALDLFGSMNVNGVQVFDGGGNLKAVNQNLVTNLNADMLDGYHASSVVLRNQVDVEVSTDGGATWAPVRFR